MYGPMDIRLPPLRDISAASARALLERALSARPDADGAKLQLARRLFDADDFSGAIGLLDRLASPDQAEAALLLAQACLARRQPGDADRVLVAARQASALAASDAAREQALLAEGRALLQLARPDEGLTRLREVLAINPGQLGAVRTLTDYLLRQADPAAVLSLVAELKAAGDGHVRLLGAESAALARQGDIRAARELAGTDQFVATLQLPAPAGWSSLAGFHAALQAEAEADPDLRQGRHGTASRATLRVDHPYAAAAPAFQALHRAIAAAAAQHIAALPGAGHPWLAARPARLAMRSWCVMTDADGYEQWHNHPAGWMSGGYYIAVPEQPEDLPQPGRLAFGVSPQLAGESQAASFGERLVSPCAGTLALFPSHAYHRTYPHGQPGRRICLAFDLVPV